MKICSLCYAELDFGYLFVIRDRETGRYKYCDHGWCLSCCRPWRQYVRTRSQKVYCPLCDRYIRKICFYQHGDCDEGGKLNPIRLDNETED